MPRRIRSRPLSAWRDPEAVFLARFAEAPYAVWLDGGADAASGVSIIAAAHAGSEFVTADAARRNGHPLRAARRGRRRVDGRGIRVRRARRTPPARAGAPSLADEAPTGGGDERPSAGSAGSATSSAHASTTSRRRPPRHRMPRSCSSTEPSCSTTARERSRLAWLEPDGDDAAPATQGSGGPRSSRRRSRGSTRHPRRSPPAGRPPRRRPTPARLASPGGTALSGTPSSSPPARTRSARATRTSCASPTGSTSTATSTRSAAYARAARVEPEPPRRLLRDRRRRPAQRVARAVPRGRPRRASLRTQPIKGTRPRGTDAGVATPSSATSCSRARRSAPRTS